MLRDVVAVVGGFGLGVAVSGLVVLFWIFRYTHSGQDRD